MVWAKLQKARIVLYREGFDRLGASTMEKRHDAVKKVEEGRQRHLDILNELKDQALQQEIYISLGRAEKVLAGALKEQNSAEHLGSLDKAIEYYRKAAAINPDSDISKHYAGEADR